MKLSALAAKPQLIPVIVDDEAIVKKYGETLEFYIYDRQDMDTFMKLATMEGEEDMSVLGDVVQKMILDEKGNPIVKDGNVLPVDVMLKVIEKTVRYLGNSVTQTLEA